MALDPSDGPTNTVQSRFSCEKMAPDALAARLAGNQKPLPCDWVILPALKKVPSALGSALTAYVQAGGGVLLFVGEGVSAIRYNTEFRELLPVQLGSMESSPQTRIRLAPGVL